MHIAPLDLFLFFFFFKKMVILFLCKSKHHTKQVENPLARQSVCYQRNETKDFYGFLRLNYDTS